MAGIVGLVDPDQRIDCQDLLARMTRSLKHEDWYKVDEYVARDQGVALGRIHLGIFNPQSQPIFNEDRSLAIVMEGEIYDYQKVKSDLVRRGHRFVVDNDPEFILHLYEEFGDDFIHSLNGSFALAIWDARTSKLVIANDRYGLRPLYYAEVGRKLLFASEVKAILEDSAFKRTVNNAGVAQLFALGHLLGEDTMFVGAFALPPASLWTYERKRLRKQQYWTPARSQQREPESDTAFLEEIRRRFLQAVKRQVSDGHKIGVPLTGGLDSRSIMAAIDHEKVPVFSFTFGIPSATDVLLAPRVSAATNGEHHLYWFQPDFLSKCAEEVVRLTDGMLNISQAHGLPAMRKVRDHAEVLLSGMAGEIWRGLLVDKLVHKASGEDEFSRVIAKKYRTYAPTFRQEAEVEEVFSSSFYPSVRGLVEQSLVEEAAKIRDDVPPSVKAECFFLTQRIRRFNTMGLVFIASQLEHRTPFLDNDYVDIILQSPVSLRAWTAIHCYVLRRCNPALASIPRDKWGIPIDASPLTFRANDIVTFACKAINKIAGTRLKKSRFYADYDAWMRGELRGFVEGILLDRRTLERGYFSEVGVRNLLDKHRRREANLHQQLCALITLELFHRQYLD